MKNFSKLLVFIGLSFVLSANAFADVAEEMFDRGYKAFVEKDYSGAEKHWKRSGDLGHVRSQNGLGIMYRDGDLGGVYPEKAADWFVMAANSGYAYAMFNLGMLHKNGSLRDADDVSAYRWLLLASTINFDENAKFQANLLSQRMDKKSLLVARNEAQVWINEFFYGLQNE